MMMNPDDPNVQAWLEPELEARIVASLLGETSAFEEAELERLMDERPEVAMFRRQLLAVHDLLDEATGQGPDDDWRLTEDRRSKVLATMRETVSAEIPTTSVVRKRRSPWIWLNTAAAAAVLMVISSLVLQNAMTSRSSIDSMMMADREQALQRLAEDQAIKGRVAEGDGFADFRYAFRGEEGTQDARLSLFDSAPGGASAASEGRDLKRKLAKADAQKPEVDFDLGMLGDLPMEESEESSEQPPAFWAFSANKLTPSAPVPTSEPASAESLRLEVTSEDEFVDLANSAAAPPTAMPSIVAPPPAPGVPPSEKDQRQGVLSNGKGAALVARGQDVSSPDDPLGGAGDDYTVSRMARAQAGTGGRDGEPKSESSNAALAKGLEGVTGGRDGRADLGVDKDGDGLAEVGREESVLRESLAMNDEGRPQSEITARANGAAGAVASLSDSLATWGDAFGVQDKFTFGRESRTLEDAVEPEEPGQNRTRYLGTVIASDGDEVKGESRDGVTRSYENFDVNGNEGFGQISGTNLIRRSLTETEELAESDSESAFETGLASRRRGRENTPLNSALGAQERGEAEQDPVGIMGPAVVAGVGEETDESAMDWARVSGAQFGGGGGTGGGGGGGPVRQSFGERVKAEPTPMPGLFGNGFGAGDRSWEENFSEVVDASGQLAGAGIASSSGGIDNSEMAVGLHSLNGALQEAGEAKAETEALGQARVHDVELQVAETFYDELGAFGGRSNASNGVAKDVSASERGAESIAQSEITRREQVSTDDAPVQWGSVAGIIPAQQAQAQQGQGQGQPQQQGGGGSRAQGRDGQGGGGGDASSGYGVSLDGKTERLTAGEELAKNVRRRVAKPQSGAPDSLRRSARQQVEDEPSLPSRPADRAGLRINSLAEVEFEDARPDSNDALALTLPVKGESEVSADEMLAFSVESGLEENREGLTRESGDLHLRGTSTFRVPTEESTEVLVSDFAKAPAPEDGAAAEGERLLAQLEPSHGFLELQSEIKLRKEDVLEGKKKPNATTKSQRDLEKLGVPQNRLALKEAAPAPAESKAVKDDSSRPGAKQRELAFGWTGRAASAKPTQTRAPAPKRLEEKHTKQGSVSTFSLHVSDVAFKLAKAAVLDNNTWPEVDKVRIEEFVNAFDYGDPAPKLVDKVACRMEQAAHPFRQQRNVLRVAMRTADVGRASGVPLQLTLLLDTSGSMERADRKESIQRAMEVLIAQLTPNDTVTLIGFARQPRLIQDRLTGEAIATLPQLVKQTPSEGGTNLEEALLLAAEHARRQFVAGGQNRVVVLTDGAANLGDADPSSLAELVVALRQEGIAFDACGVGSKGLNDTILEALTRQGDGRYYFLDGPEDADGGFARQLAGAFRPAARNVKVQVHFNERRVGHYRLVGFEKHRLKKEDFRNDRVDAAEMASSEAGVALYEIEALPQGEGEIGEIAVRFQDMASGHMVERTWTIPYHPSVPALDQASHTLQLASVAAFLGEKLKRSAFGEIVDLNRLAQTTANLRQCYGSSARVTELVAMIEKVKGW